MGLYLISFSICLLILSAFQDFYMVILHPTISLNVLIRAVFW